ncbi:hypothetical protein [Rhabdothermincola salaria]|uniref:hypothetical protein n=1 Tax=Rhabdothermincola salaria TaxID=2903142 RepID=UPI001E53DD7C|nr:hypothetical protein [Rhabdothermincola salaria]MCD9622428.1 hypothetical protein [Rhabdothermincola salaria]
MRNLAVFLLAFVTTWIVLLTLAVVVARWKLQRRNRVSPAVKSPAPLLWLWSPTQPARLHRRLQGAVTEIHLAPSRRAQSTGSVDDMRRELEYQAVEIDHHLVVASRHPRRSRRALMATLQSQVDEVEQLSIRLSRLSRPAGAVATGWELSQQPPEVLARLNEQLDLLDAAGDELDAIERASGLGDVEVVLAPLERKAHAPVSPLAPAPEASSSPPAAAG